MREAGVLASGISLLSAGPAAAGQWHEMMPWRWMGSGMWLFWILVIAFVVFFVARRAETPGSESETPMEILRKRLARGEITEEEFDRLKKKIES
jgi:putative membrane protein